MRLAKALFIADWEKVDPTSAIVVEAVPPVLSVKSGNAEAWVAGVAPKKPIAGVAGLAARRVDPPGAWTVSVPWTVW